MGIDIETARFMLRRSRRGMDLDKVATIGRQHLQVGRRELEGLIGQAGLDDDWIAGIDWRSSSRPFAEAFLLGLGASNVDSIDYSAYEGATILHDLNRPIPENLIGKFTTVMELGSLEHIFHFTNALENIMKMVAVGGHFIWATPANNFFGHGFYQFSPELVFRALSKENGFQVEEVIAVEYGPRRSWYQVRDPKEVRDRVKLINSYPVMLLVSAFKERACELFARPPLQSDYVGTWESGPEASGILMSRKPVHRRFKDLLIEGCPKLARGLQALQGSGWNRHFSFRNPASFRRVDKDRF